MNFDELINDSLFSIKQIKSLLSKSFSRDFYESKNEFEYDLLNEEDVNQKELNRLLIRVSSNIINMAHSLKSGNVNFNLKTFKEFITDVIHINTKFHNDDSLSELSYKLQDDLMANLMELNKQIIEWNKKYKNKIPTISDVRKMIDEEKENFFSHFNY